MTIASEFRHVPAQPPLEALKDVKLTGGTSDPLYPEVRDFHSATLVDFPAPAALLEDAA